MLKVPPQQLLTMNREFIQNLQVKNSLTTQEISKAVDILFNDSENASDAAILLSIKRNRTLARDIFIYSKIRNKKINEQKIYPIIIALFGYQYRPIDNILASLLSKPHNLSLYIFKCLYSGNKSLAARFWIQEIKKVDPTQYNDFVTMLKSFPANDLRRIKLQIASVSGYHKKFPIFGDTEIVDLRSMFDTEINRLLKPEKRPIPLIAKK